MPSGDSLQAGIFATMIILYSDNKFRILAILLIPAAMLGRIFYNLHYWFDCIIGASLGICISVAVYNVINMYTY
jgi:membrane-associated phospholipid phosphatase